MSSIRHASRLRTLIFANTGKVSDDRISARVSSQWLIKNNTCFQQVVVTNTGAAPIKDFGVRAKYHMLIRDLDHIGYLSYNERYGRSYIRGQGPNGFSWITANLFDGEESVPSQDNDKRGHRAAPPSDFKNEGEGLQSPGLRNDPSQTEQPTSSPAISSGEHFKSQTTSGQGQIYMEHGLSSGNGQSAGLAEQARISQDQISAEEHETVGRAQEHAQNETKRPLNDGELWQKRRITDTWSAKDAHAVISIMSLFVNGTAEKMTPGRPHIHRTLGASGSESSVLEITVAYRMIVIPREKVHWRNFLIPAETADVAAMLAAETKQLWGHSVTEDCNCSHSLRDIGICMKGRDEHDGEKDTSGRGQTSQNPGFQSRGVQKDMAVHDDVTTNANSQMDVSTEVLTAAGLSNQQKANYDTDSRPTTGITVGVSQKSSCIDSIEYLTWRHTEHILSVCAIPLSVPPLSQEGELSQQSVSARNDVTTTIEASDWPEGEEVEPEVPLALTCGDMSGHRICSSASL